MTLPLHRTFALVLVFSGALACETPTEPESVASIAVSPTAVELASGDARSLIATVTSDRGNVLNDYALSWTSSDAGVVSVSGSGVLRAGTVLSPERQSAMVTASGGGVSASVAVSVLPAPAARVVIAAPETRLASYASVTLAAQVQAAGGQILQGRSIEWTSSDTTIAVVSPAGMVVARGVLGGTPRPVTITAAIDSITGTVVLPVDPAPIRSISLRIENSAVASGATADIEPTLRDSAGAVLTGRTLQWSVSDSAVAQVSVAGRLTAGFVIGGVPAVVHVRLRAESVTDSVRVTVQPSPVDRIVPSTTSLGLSVGGNRQLSADLFDARNVRLTSRAVTFSSADTTVATVSDGGLVTARASGATTIRVQSEGKQAVVAVETIRWVDVGAGDSFSCALTHEGAVYCWGENNSGQLGDGTTMSRVTPVRVNTTLRFRSIAVGNQHSCGITSDAGIACWGRNGFGQLGDSTTVQRSLPVRLPGSRTFSAVTTAGSHTCAVTTEGDALCWGRNVDGALGNGTNTNSFVPVPVTGGIRFSSLAAREFSTCGLDGAGRGFCWGNNGWLALGVGNGTSANVPLAIVGGERYSGLAQGGADTGCAIGLSGLAFCWGRNREYQVGNQTVGDVVTHSQVSSNVAFRVLAIGDSFTCGVSVNDDLYCWGVNRFQRLGALQELNNKPEFLEADGKFNTVDAGRDHLCGITRAGVLQCRGRGNQGALGDGTLTAQRGDFRPVTVQ